VAIVWTVVFWLGSFLFGGNPHRVSIWTADVQFVFAGADRGEYPNGMPFTASDLLSPPVLQRAINNVEHLPEDLDVAGLSSMLSVAAYFPGADELRASYEARLNDELSLAEIQELEATFLRDFHRGAHNRARLFLTSSRSDLPVTELLQAIPVAWSDYMQKDYGVFRTDRTLYSQLAVDIDSVNKADPLMVYLLLRQQVLLLNQNTQVLQEEPGSGNVVDSESGLGLADIKARIDRFNELVLEGQITDLLQAAAQRNPEQARRFLDIRIARHSQDLALLQSKSTAVEQALDDYDVDQFTAVESVTDGMGVNGENFLNRLIALGVEGGDMEFRQELTRERLDFDLEAALVASDQQRLMSLIGELDQNVSGNAGAELPDGLQTDQFSDRLDRLLVSSQQLFDVINRLAATLDSIRYGSDADMVNIGQIRNDPEWTSGRFTSVHRDWYVFSLAALLIATALIFMSIRLFSTTSAKFSK